VPQSPHGGLPPPPLRSKLAELVEARVAPWDDAPPSPLATSVGLEAVRLGVPDIAAEVAPRWCIPEKWGVFFWGIHRRDMREDPLS
jgi:hypothetical protein